MSYNGEEKRKTQPWQVITRLSEEVSKLSCCTSKLDERLIQRIVLSDQQHKQTTQRFDKLDNGFVSLNGRLREAEVEIGVIKGIRDTKNILKGRFLQNRTNIIALLAVLVSIAAILVTLKW